MPSQPLKDLMLPATIAPGTGAIARPDAEGSQGQRIDFIMEVASALSAFGSPAHRVEEAMMHCARQLGLEASFFSLPTAVYAMFGGSDDSRTVLRRVPSVGVNLERLVQLDQIRRDVSDGGRSPAAGLRDVRGLLAMPPRYTGATSVIAFGVVSAACAVLFRGGTVELVTAAAIGIGIGILDHLGTRAGTSRRLLDFFSGLLATVIAFAVASLFGPLAYDIALVGGLIVLMPGLTITMAVKELSTVNLVSGTARLMGALTILAAIGFGVAVGYRLFDFGLIPEHRPAPLPTGLHLTALFAAGLSLALLLHGRLRDIPAMLLVSCVGYLAAFLGTAALGAEPGACLAAACIGLSSNLCSRLRNVPSVVTMVPGIILLVPGSTGFRSVVAFLADDSVAAVDAGFTMIFTAMALVSGLLLANAALPSRHAL